MIEDAENGMFDLIVTKAVSRFARNTLDSLMYSRKLFEVGVGIWFDTDGILNLDKDGELRLSIFSALAQDESEKIGSRSLWSAGSHQTRYGIWV